MAAAAPAAWARLRSDRHAPAGSHVAYPVITSPEGWIAKACAFNPNCKSCDPRGQVHILRWLILRALREPYDGERVTLRQMVIWLDSECGVQLREDGLKAHVKNHVELIFVKPTESADPVATRVSRVEQELVKVTPEQRIAEVRAEVARRVETSTEPDHIAYLQSVVGIAQAVIVANPERVTPEMGLRAASELSRIKASAERDKMLEILARSARPLPVLEAAP